MATKVQRSDVLWDSDLTVSDVAGHAGGLHLVIEDYSPLDGEFGMDRFGEVFILPYRLHFANGRTVRVPDSDMAQMIRIHGFPDAWRGRIATVVITDVGLLSGGCDGDNRIAETLYVELAIH